MEKKDMDRVKIQIAEKEFQLLVLKQAFAERYGKLYEAPKDMTSSTVHPCDTNNIQSKVANKEAKEGYTMQTHNVKVSEEVKTQELEKEQEKDLKRKRPGEIAMAKEKASKQERVENIEASKQERVENMEISKGERVEDMEVPKEERTQLFVDVDNEGYPCGVLRRLWLRCMRDHSQHIEFNRKKYEKLDNSMVLAVKEKMDNIFEYRGGLGKVPDKVFYSELQRQLQGYAKKKAHKAKKKPWNPKIPRSWNADMDEYSLLSKGLEELLKEVKEEETSCSV